MLAAADPSPVHSPHFVLRAATTASHDVVDRAFSSFDLTQRAPYAAFLIAHARVLPPIEAMLGRFEGAPAFEPRTSALRADLAAYGLPLPTPLPIPPFASSAAMWGTVYVIEGSRLGGVMLSRRIPADAPKAYLGAAHGAGGWRNLLGQFDRAAMGRGPDWVDQAIEAARSVFALYAEAVAPASPFR